MNEEKCKYVSSRGILKSCDYYSFNPVSDINHMTDYPKYSTKIFKDKDHFPVIHVCTTALMDFLLRLFPYIKHPFILVTNDADITSPTDIFSSGTQFDTFINSPFLVHWYSQNCIMTHPKITRIPIGMDYHTINRLNRISPFNQENLLKYVKGKSTPFWDRKIKCHASFQFNMGLRYCDDRRDAIKSIPSECVDYLQQKLPRHDTWYTQIQYSFVISPHGNGYDCHRTWEALILGCIPIVKKSDIDELYSDLPVLIVNEWSDVTPELLQSTVDHFKTLEFNYDKLTLKYWVKKIRYNA